MLTFTKATAYTLLQLFLCFSCMAQAGSQVDCKVTDKNQKPLAFAAVALLNKNDSAVMKSAVTDDKGFVFLASVPGGQYLIAINMTGYNSYISSPFTVSAESNKVDIGTIELEPSSVSLNEVQVVYKKPFIEAQADKIVVNVESSVTSAGSSVLDVLQKSPGVVIDNNDNISMRGKQGVIVMIDDKPVVLSGSDLGNMLRGMPAESIEKIELITNPSAKYDAEGNAGIINIKTKKDKRFGTNGSITASYGQGKYPKSNDGFNINNRSRRFNLFASYNYGYRKAFSDLTLNRKFYANDVFDGGYLQENYFKSPYISHVAKAGADWYITDKTIAGVVVSGMSIDHNTTGDNISQDFDADNIYNSYFTTSNYSTNKLDNYAVNGNFKTTFDSLGRELTADIDYANYDSKTTQDFTTNYYDIYGNQNQPAYILHGSLNGSLDIKSVKADYTLPLKNAGKIEAGVKSSVVNADNDLVFYDRSQPVEVYDSSKSNHFLYTENINAGYINYSREKGLWSCQLGMRVENTNATGKQLLLDSSFDNHYIQLFPSFFLQRKLSEANQLSFTVSRRIDRPDYRQLNPFKFFLDPSTYAVGNPYLKPQLTWAFELTETYLQRIITTLAYSRTTDNITTVLAPSTTENKITIQTDANLATFDYYGFIVSLPLTVTKWWETQNNINTYYAHYTGDIANTNLNNGNLTFNLNSNNTFTLSNNMNAELNILYRAKEVYGYMTVDPVKEVSVGIQKNMLNRKLSVKLNVHDVFYSVADAADTHFNTYDEKFVVKRDTRFATLALTYRFGNGVMTPRRKTGGADEEKNRATSG